MMIITQDGMAAIASERVSALEISKIVSAEKFELVAAYRMGDTGCTRKCIGHFATAETAKLALEYIAFCIAVGCDIPVDVPKEEKMRVAEMQKKRAEAKRDSGLEELLRNILQGGPEC